MSNASSPAHRVPSRYQGRLSLGHFVGSPAPQYCIYIHSTSVSGTNFNVEPGGGCGYHYIVAASNGVRNSRCVNQQADELGARVARPHRVTIVGDHAIRDDQIAALWVTTETVNTPPAPPKCTSRRLALCYRCDAVTLTVAAGVGVVRREGVASHRLRCIVTPGQKQPKVR